MAASENGLAGPRKLNAIRVRSDRMICRRAGSAARFVGTDCALDRRLGRNSVMDATCVQQTSTN
jgi:hypothetical protein